MEHCSNSGNGAWPLQPPPQKKPMPTGNNEEERFCRLRNKHPRAIQEAIQERVVALRPHRVRTVATMSGQTPVHQDALTQTAHRTLGLCCKHEARLRRFFFMVAMGPNHAHGYKAWGPITHMVVINLRSFWVVFVFSWRPFDGCNYHREGPQIYPKFAPCADRGKSALQGSCLLQNRDPKKATPTEQNVQRQHCAFVAPAPLLNLRLHLPQQCHSSTLDTGTHLRHFALRKLLRVQRLNSGDGGVSPTLALGLVDIPEQDLRAWRRACKRNLVQLLPALLFGLLPGVGLAR